MSATPPPGTVEVRLDESRTLRAALCRNDSRLDLRRVRQGRWHDPIGQLSRTEAERLHRGLGTLIATMTAEAER